MSDERRETRITLHVPSGVILDVDSDPPELPDTLEDVPPSEWRQLGSIDANTGRPEIDWTRASRWRPLSEFWRWR
jgi:hypothetical protein